MQGRSQDFIPGGFGKAGGGPGAQRPGKIFRLLYLLELNLHWWINELVSIFNI